MTFLFRSFYTSCNEKYINQGGRMEVVEVKETIPSRMKNFVSRHKVGIAIFSTAGVCLLLNRVALRDHDAFLAKKGLLDEFYTPSDDEA